MPSLIAARWVGQISGSIVRRLWTKVHRIKFAGSGVPMVWQRRFQIDDIWLRSGDIRHHIMQLCEITPKF